MAKGTKKTWRSLFNIEEQEEAPTEQPVDGNALQALAQAVADLEARVATLETTQTEVKEDIETVKDVVDTEEFARLKSNLPAILKNFGKLDTLATRVPSRNPKGDKNARFNFL
jgi:uncharacterized coiled-coil protein SlyX